jgi:integrase
MANPMRRGFASEGGGLDERPPGVPQGIPDRAGPPSRPPLRRELRAELSRAAEVAGVDHVIPHQRRHKYATAMVNASVSSESLMALLGHVSAEMTLRD